MKFKNTAKTGSNISLIVSLIALIMFLIVNIIPSVDYNTLNMTDKFMYDMGVYKGETPVWKNVFDIIAIILVFVSMIIDFIMCRCNNCGSYIRFISSKKYCPHCSKNLDTTAEEIKNEINSKKE